MFIRSVTWKSGVMNRRICRPLKIQEMVLGSPPLMLQLSKSARVAHQMESMLYLISMGLMRLLKIDSPDTMVTLVI